MIDSRVDREKRKVAFVPASTQVVLCLVLGSLFLAGHLSQDSQELAQSVNLNSDWTLP